METSMKSLLEAEKESQAIIQEAVQKKYIFLKSNS
jgi:hypothetical protein